MPTTKPTTADVLQALGAARSIADQLTPDNVAQLQKTLQMQIDQCAALAKQSQLEPGAYVTGGAAAAMAGVATLVGGVAGFFVGQKFPSKPRTAALPAHKGEEEAGAAEEDLEPEPPRRYPRRRVAARQNPAAREETPR
jgi:hypothetical protein